MTTGQDDTGAWTGKQATAPDAAGNAPRPRSRTLRINAAIFAALMFAGFFALGTWQVFRLQWKLALIERVNQRVHAEPVAAPGRADWARVAEDSDAYRPVRLTGVYLPASATRVLASTERGVGYWLLTPMCTADGGIVMVNRGFLPAGEGGWKPQPAPPPADGAAACAQAAAGASVTVSGLLRISEAGGSWVRKNEPARNFWYTRDVQAIARARGLPPVAPYFVDADARGEVPAALAGAADAGAQPVGGMTVVSFVNNHLVYAVTWYALALMMAGATVWVVRHERNGRPD
jgi:surfeit locus 1 family protein